MTAPGAAARVRRARAADLPQLAAIERAAAALFRTQAIEGDFLERTVAMEDLRAGLGAGRLWVAAGPDERPVGFALATLLAGVPHLEELDVHPEHGRRGLGAALVAAVLAWARAAGHASVTLITFRDVPWNAPFYERLGFRPLAAEALGPALRARLAGEARRGLPMERRVVMRAALATSEVSSTAPCPAPTPGDPPALAASVAGLALRPESAADEAAADAIHEAAFGRRAEADLVRALRREEPSYLGLVATAGGRPVGHVAFSAVALDAAGPPGDAFGLAPLAVAPAAQRRGVGSALVRAGLAACAARGAALVFVLGHPGYYPRFGFRPAFEFGFHYGRPEPEPAFFALELAPGAARGRGGRVRYAAAFDRL